MQCADLARQCCFLHGERPCARSHVHTYLTNILPQVSLLTCCAEEVARPVGHPTECLVTQMSVSALRTQLSPQKTSEQHWQGAASLLSHPG